MYQATELEASVLMEYKTPKDYITGGLNNVFHVACRAPCPNYFQWLLRNVCCGWRIAQAALRWMKMSRSFNMLVH